MDDCICGEKIFLKYLEGKNGIYFARAGSRINGIELGSRGLVDLQGVNGKLDAENGERVTN